MLDTLTRLSKTPLPVVLTLGLALFVANAFFSPWQLEFQRPMLNELVSIAAMIALPAVLGLWALRIPYDGLRRIASVVALVIAAPCGLVALLSSFTLTPYAAHDSPFAELIDETSAEAGEFRLYRTDCGAPCAFGLILQHEHDLPFGLKLSQPIWSKYRESEGHIHVEGRHLRVLNDQLVLWEHEV